jgi:hypothetical protein
VEFFHSTLASDGRMPAFATEVQRRGGVRALIRCAGPRLALFCLADDHAHVVSAGSRGETGHLGRAVRAALAHASGVAIDAARIRPVESRSHAEWLARRYIVGQAEKHGLRDDPALYSGSCFQDLAGARRVVDLRIDELLPRFRIEDVMPAVGLPAHRITPVGKGDIRRLGVTRVAEAAAAALALDNLRGLTAPVVAARRVAVQLCDRASIARSEIAHGLRLSMRAVRMIVAEPFDMTLARAVCVRLALEELRARQQRRAS